jgi:flagellar basal body rod protein FlgG
MIRGFYASVSGILASMTRQSIVAGNIANVNTPGFHQSRSTTSDLGFELAQSTGRPIGWLGTATIATGLTLDRSQGPLEQTGRPTDLAIEGDGLFVIGSPAGVAYTRAGDFVVDLQSILVTGQGYPVLDTTGRPIVTGGTLSVAADGTVLETGQRIALVGWPQGEPTRIGETLMTAPGPLAPADGSIHQGMLERSNTDVTSAMTELIVLQRHFALSARSLALQDETLGDAAQVGRL